MYLNLIGSCKPGKVYLIRRGGKQGWMQKAGDEESGGEALWLRGFWGELKGKLRKRLEDRKSVV